ncbi:MAG TPA: hypothetical protein VN918_06900, partial [Myxococcaceae bacterium]|nr:hypothetical protein [Myxococcaceae bacterium]
MSNGSAQGSKVKRPNRRTLKILFFLAAVVIAVIIFVNTPFAWEQGCALARQELPSLLGMKIGIGRCELDALARTVKLYDVSASPMEGQTGPSFTAESIEARISSFRPLFRKAELDFLKVTRPRVDLAIDKEPAPASLVSPCPFDALARVHIGELQVTEAEVRARLPDGQRLEVTDLGITWFEQHGVAQFKVVAGQGTLSIVKSHDLPISNL